MQMRRMPGPAVSGGARPHAHACTPPSPWHSDPTAPAPAPVPPRAGICGSWHLHLCPRHFHVVGSSTSCLLPVGASSWAKLFGQNSACPEGPQGCSQRDRETPTRRLGGCGHQSSMWVAVAGLPASAEMGAGSGLGLDLPLRKALPLPVTEMQ